MALCSESLKFAIKKVPISIQKNFKNLLGKPSVPGNYGKFYHLFRFLHSALFHLPKIQSRNCKVQNIVAKLVFNRRRYESSTESRKLLHWLPIVAWIAKKTFSNW